MTPDERQMIADLFERLRSFGPVEKDREADQFITQLVRQTPDAGYMLVQSVLVQENTLQETGNRMQELEDQVRYLEQQLQQQQAPAPAAGRWGGSFLGGSRGAPQPQQRPAAQSVPVTNRSTGFGQAPAAPPPGSSPWGRQAGGYQQPAQMQPQQQAAGGGGFMRTAMATAAGVAGGIFAANAIKDMMGGNSGQAQAGQASNQEASPHEVNQDQGQADQSYGYQSPENNDPGNTDSAENSDWGGDAGGGGDVEL